MNSAQSAELQIIIWFLDSDWEVYTPFADQGTDIIVRRPDLQESILVQIKHKQHDSKNEGFLDNPWHQGGARFNYLIFFQPSKMRGVILGREDLVRKGRRISFYKKDAAGYPTGGPRPLFRPFAFDLREVLHEHRARTFTDFFFKFHLQAQTRLPLGQEWGNWQRRQRGRITDENPMSFEESPIALLPPRAKAIPATAFARSFLAPVLTAGSRPPGAR